MGDHPRRFGETAVDLGFITEEQLADDLELQRSMRERGGATPIGVVLVDQGHLSFDQVFEVLKAMKPTVVVIDADAKIGDKTVKLEPL